MNKKFQLMSLVALVAASALAVAAVDGLTVKRTPKAGVIYKYKMTGDGDFNGTPVTITANVQEKILKVADSGNFDVEQTQLDGKINVNGADQDMPSSGPVVTVYKPTGEVDEIRGDNVAADTYRMANLGILFDAGKPLNVGDSWTYDIKPDAKKGSVAGKAEYKVIAEEKVGDVDTLKVHATVKETGGSDAASSDWTEWLDKKDGSMVKTEAKWVNAPFPGAPGPLNATIKLTRTEVK